MGIDRTFWASIEPFYKGGESAIHLSNLGKLPNFPVLPFLVFWNSLFFSPCEEFLVFLSVFPFFSRDFRGSVGIKNPCFFGCFPCLFPKKNKERKDRVGPGPFIYVRPVGGPENYLC